MKHHQQIPQWFFDMRREAGEALEKYKGIEHTPDTLKAIEQEVNNLINKWKERDLEVVNDQFTAQIHSVSLSVKVKDQKLVINFNQD